MADIANLFISIGSKFDPSGINATISKLDEFQKRTENVAKGFQIAGAALTAFSAAGVIVIKSLVAEAVNQEAAEVALAAAMKQAGTYTEEAMKHNVAYATSLMKITTYGDDAINGVQKLLSNFKIEGPMLDKVTKATLDLAAAKKMDLASAADIVSKSVGGSTNALARYGIVIEGAAGSTDRAQMAVDNISKLFGGSAEAQTKSFAGQLLQLSNRFGEVKETIGFMILPVLKKLLDIGGVLLSWLENLNPTILKVITYAGLLAVALAGVAGPILLAIGFLPQMVTGLTLLGGAFGVLKAAMLAHPIFLIAAALIAATVAVDAYYNANNKHQGDEAQYKKTLEGKIQGLKDYRQELVENYKAGKISETEFKAGVDSNIIAQQKLESQLAKTAKTTKKEVKNMGNDWADMFEGMEDEAGKAAKKIADAYAKTLDAVSTVIGLTQSITTGYYDLLKININDNLQTTLNDEQIKYDNKKAWILANITDETERNTALELLDKEHRDAVESAQKAAKDQERIEREKIKPLLIAEATANVALGVTKAFAQGGVLGFITGALVAVAGAIEIAKINATKFASGGMALGAQMGIIGEAGAEIALPLNHPNTISALSGALKQAAAGVSGMVSGLGGGQNIYVTVPALSSRRAAQDMGNIVGNAIYNKLRKTRRI